MKTLFLVAVALASACSSSNICTPGQSIACACVGGGTGAQVCQTNGTYAACDCTATIPINTGQDMDDTIIVPILDLGGTTRAGNKRFFTTSAAYPPTLGGLAGADGLCNTVAAGANLGGRWIAWLSDGSKNAIDRVTDVGPWFRLDGMKLFNNKANMAGSALATTAVNENGMFVGGTVWTGTNTGGTGAASNCISWTSGSSFDEGMQGETSSATLWTQDGVGNCNSTAHLYCIEQ
jgi:hypothetical protein